jgi:ATP-dependent Lhr-like helicase
VRSAWSYRHLTTASGNGRWTSSRAAAKPGGLYPNTARAAGRDGVYRVPDAALARRHRMGIGTIVSDAAMQVKFMSGGRIGSVEESFIAACGRATISVAGASEFVRCTR